MVAQRPRAVGAGPSNSQHIDEELRKLRQEVKDLRSEKKGAPQQKPGPNVSSVPDSSTTIGAHFSTSITAISLALALGEPYPPAPHRVCSLAPLILAVCACRSCIRRQLASTNCTACRSQAGAAESSRARSACQELTLHRRISLVRVVLSHLSCAECCGWLYACTRFESSGSRARALPPHTACA